ncbi:MAG: alpha/beta hydrolase [Bacteroidota bacterium]
MDQTFSFRQAPVRYRDDGQGMAVVLLHGFLETLEMWDELAVELQRTCRVIRVDLPGHGGTGCFGYLHPMELMAEVVHAVLQRCKVRKCVMIGHSMGGYVTLAFADRYPDYLKGYGLYHSSSRADTGRKKADRDQAIRLVKQNHRSFIRKAIPLLFRHKFRVQYREEVNRLKKAALKGVSKQGIIAALEGMKQRPNREVILRFSPVPVLFRAGQRDPVFPFQSLEEQFTLSEHIRPVVLKEAGHMSFIEDRKPAFKALKRFVNQCR